MREEQHPAKKKKYQLPDSGIIGNLVVVIVVVVVRTEA